MTSNKLKTILNILFTSFLLISLVACNSTESSRSSQVNLVKELLTERQTLGNGFSIQLPDGYVFEEVDREDFVSYYFYHEDDIDEVMLDAGIYIGNHPSEFTPFNNCKKNNVEEIILGEKCSFDYYICDEGRFIQQIIENPNSQGWNEKLHLFSFFKNEEDLNLALALFSTLVDETNQDEK